MRRVLGRSKLLWHIQHPWFFFRGERPPAAPADREVEFDVAPPPLDGVFVDPAGRELGPGTPYEFDGDKCPVQDTHKVTLA